MPLVGARKPSSISKVVVLPAPFGPSTATSWPSGISKLTPSTAAKSPKRLVSSSTAMAVTPSVRRRPRGPRGRSVVLLQGLRAAPDDQDGAESDEDGAAVDGDPGDEDDGADDGADCGVLAASEEKDHGTVPFWLLGWTVEEIRRGWSSATVMPPTAMRRAWRTSSTSGVGGLPWRNQCKTAARSAATTTPATSSGSRSPSAAPVRAGDHLGQRPLAGGLGLEVLAVQGRLGGHQGAEPVQPSLGQTFLAGRPVQAGDHLDRASASGSPAGRSSRSVASRTPRRVVGHTIAASLLAK